jgi:hypothetical protein
MKAPKCINCGKTEDQCECDFFESEGEEGGEELDGMSIKDAEGNAIEDEELEGEELEEESY